MSKRVKYMSSGTVADNIAAAAGVTKEVFDSDLMSVAKCIDDSFDDLFTLEDLIEAVSTEYDWSWEEAAHVVIDSMQNLINAGLAVLYNVPD